MTICCVYLSIQSHYNHLTQLNILRENLQHKLHHCVTDMVTLIVNYKCLIVHLRVEKTGVQHR